MKIRKCMTLVFLLGLLLSGPAWAGDDHRFARLVIFGDSLSDPGNLFILTGEQAVPPYDGTHDELLVPNAAYSVGGHHFSNGRTWIEQLAVELDLSQSARPAYLGMGGQNYAIAGARALDDPEREIDLVDQVGTFVLGGGAPLLSDALVVVQFGGNDVRAAIGLAIGLIGMGVDPMTALEEATDVLERATASIAASIVKLNGLGANNVVVALAPNLARAPAIDILDRALHHGRGLPRGAVISLASVLSARFNDLLLGSLPKSSFGDDANLVVFDLFQTVENVIADPDAFDLEKVRAACVMPGVPPFHCEDADEFLFWDGIHPTRVGHAALKAQALAVLDDTGLIDHEDGDDEGDD